MIYSLYNIIEQVSEKNDQNIYGLDSIVGVTIDKKIIPTIANLTETNLEKFNLVKPNYFVYNPRTHGKKIGLGYNNSENTYIATWNNITFRIKKEMEKIILPEYLYLYFNREIWDKEACFHAWGTSTVVLSWDEFSSMKIYIPSIESQKRLVKEYTTINNYINLLEKENLNLEKIINIYFKQNVLNNDCSSVKLNSIATISAGGDNPDGSSKMKTEKNCIPIISNGVQNDGLFGYTNIARINKPSITISARGTIGYTSIHFEPYTPIVRLISVTPKDKNEIGYIYAYLKTLTYTEDGSVQQQVTKPFFEDLAIPYLNKEEIERVNLFLNTAVSLIDKNKKKISSLNDMILCVISKVGGKKNEF